MYWFGVLVIGKLVTGYIAITNFPITFSYLCPQIAHQPIAVPIFVGNEESPDNIEQPHHLTGGLLFEKSRRGQRVSQKNTAPSNRSKGENVR